jgi:hypothetical protein
MIRAVDLAIYSALPPAEKLALIAICNVIDDHGEGWLFAARLARAVGRNPRQCRRVVAALVERGLVEVDVRGAKLRGRSRAHSANLYRVDLAKLEEMAGEPPSSVRSSTTTQRVDTGDHTGPPCVVAHDRTEAPCVDTGDRSVWSPMTGLSKVVPSGDPLEEEEGGGEARPLVDQLFELYQDAAAIVRARRGENLIDRPPTARQRTLIQDRVLSHSVDTVKAGLLALPFSPWHCGIDLAPDPFGITAGRVVIRPSARLSLEQALGVSDRIDQVQTLADLLANPPWEFLRRVYGGNPWQLPSRTESEPGHEL